MQRVQAEGQVFDYEVKLPDLSERWLRVNAAVISNSAGEREGMILVFHDLTRLEAARAHARGICRQRQPRAAHAAFPHQGLRGDAARRRAEQSRGGRALSEIIERNTNRLDLLIQDLLTISALESGRMKLNLQAGGRAHRRGQGAGGPAQQGGGGSRDADQRPARAAERADPNRLDQVFAESGG